MRGLLCRLFVAVIAVLCMSQVSYAVDSDWPFELTTTPDTASLQFQISASGTFTVDCGDGGILSGAGVSGDTITKNNTYKTLYACTYDAVGVHTIRFGGAATGYSTDTEMAAMWFSFDGNAKKIAGIDGSLGAIFGTVNGNQPRFVRTFGGATNMIGSIPENLFAGISGAPTDNMFGGTFFSCFSLTGGIPENLFAGISGVPKVYMFRKTFSGCVRLTGNIPKNLFAGISGAPADGMFNDTFYRCSGLTGKIPARLFGNIYGAPANDMFDGTFGNCRGLTGYVPYSLFSGISGVGTSGDISGFDGTFDGASSMDTECPFGADTVIKPSGFGDVAFCRFDGCPDGYDGGNDVLSPSDCVVSCSSGTYVGERGGQCINVGEEYWAAPSVVVLGDIGTRNVCPTGLKTSGSGTGADEAADCGRVVHIGDHTLRLRNEKRTSPSLAVRVGDYVLYGDTTTEKRGHLRVNYNGQTYSVYNPDID